MLGLLYKDFCLIKKNILIGMLIILASVAFAVIFVLGMRIGNFKSIRELSDIYELFFKGCIYVFCLTGITVALTSFTIIEKDEKAEWYKVLYSSPVNVLKEVLSRYIIAFLINTIMCLFAGIMLPVIYAAGARSVGTGELKIIGICWVLGMCTILIRLPIDIIFSARKSAVISTSILCLGMIVLMIWLLKVEAEVIFSKLSKVIDVVYDYKVAVIILLAMASFSISYFVKKNRRWA